MKTNTGKEEVCDETCDCHDTPLVVVGDRVYTSETGGSGMSDEMKALLKLKETLKQKGE